jgi:hypothetical protein
VILTLKRNTPLTDICFIAVLKLIKRPNSLYNKSRGNSKALWRMPNDNPEFSTVLRVLLAVGLGCSHALPARL